VTSGKKLLIVVGVQFLVLLSVIGFKQYTVWTSDTVLLKTAPIDPHALLGGDSVHIRYEISSVERSLFVDGEAYPGLFVEGEAYPGQEVFVELQKGADGYWSVVAVHPHQESSYDGTVLLKARVESYPYVGSTPVTLHYGIEQVFVPEGSGAGLPSGSGHTVAVEVRVDRFGHAVPLRFFVDGQPFDLKRQ
jgi:uncharacterized membrane-anchored protein